MADLGFEIIFIFILLLANSVFAMAEIAVVTSRRARLKTRADAGDAGAALALELAASPGRFLSTVQVGITLVGILAGAMGGAHIAANLAPMLEKLPMPHKAADYLSIFLVVTIITYLSVIIGELVPKRLALNHPESIASALARPMNMLASFVSPVVGILNLTSDGLLKLIGVNKSTEPPVSEEEVRLLIDEGLHAGVFQKSEKEMVEGVLDLEETKIEEIMTPAARLIWLSLDDTNEENWRRVAGSGHSNFPVCQKNRDNVVGMVSVKWLWANLSLAGNAELAALVTPPLYVPTTMPAGKLIEEFRRHSRQVALAVDEFGTVQGLVTVKDVMISIVGNLPESDLRDAPKAVRREDGSWLVDALLDIGDVRDQIGLQTPLPGEGEGAYVTLAGFLISRIGSIPREGDRISWDGLCFEIMDMDRQRIDKVLISRVDPPPAKTEPPVNPPA